MKNIIGGYLISFGYLKFSLWSINKSSSFILKIALLKEYEPAGRMYTWERRNTYYTLKCSVILASFFFFFLTFFYFNIILNHQLIQKFNQMGYENFNCINTSTNLVSVATTDGQRTFLFCIIYAYVSLVAKEKLGHRRNS